MALPADEPQWDSVIAFALGPAVGSHTRLLKCRNPDILNFEELSFGSMKIIILKTLQARNVKFSAYSFSHFRQYFIAQHAYCIVHEYI